MTVNLLGLSTFLCFLFLDVIDDGEPHWLVVISLFFLSGVANDGEPKGLRLVVISWVFSHL
jgi:hypothetical protein